MRNLVSIVIAATLVICLAESAQAQFEPGEFSVRPEVGLGIANSFGVTFGGAAMYVMNDRLAFGPAFHFSTAGRQWEISGQNQSFSTKGSNSMTIAGRVYYLVTPDSDYPWYVNAGFGLVNFGSVSEFEDGNKIIVSVDNQNQELKIKSAMKIAVNLGTGTTFPIGNKMNLVIDANSYIGSHGDVKGEIGGQEVDVSELFEGGAFWILHTTVGLSIPF